MKARLLALILFIAIAACSRINEENFAKIQEGMSEQDVMQILGKPSETNSVNILGVSGTVARWSGRDAVITVRFVNDKVALKSFDRPGEASK
jgi:SmpA / OmlA family